VTRKSESIAKLIEGLQGNYDAHYLGFFQCFNRQDYYEAHDVLEELWLTCKGQPDYLYYKGLIQAAGAFVHMKKQREYPTHHVHGKRLPAAGRLLTLALTNLRTYPGVHLNLDVAHVCMLLDGYYDRLELNQFQVNPYDPLHPPRIPFPSD